MINQKSALGMGCPTKYLPRPSCWLSGPSSFLQQVDLSVKSDYILSPNAMLRAHCHLVCEQHPWEGLLKIRDVSGRTWLRIAHCVIRRGCCRTRGLSPRPPSCFQRSAWHSSALGCPRNLTVSQRVRRLGTCIERPLAAGLPATFRRQSL